MSKLMVWFGGRKFFLACLGVCSAIVLMLLGAMTVEEGFDKLLWFAVAYIGVEGAADVADRFGLKELFAKLFSKKAPAAK